MEKILNYIVENVWAQWLLLIIFAYLEYEDLFYSPQPVDPIDLLAMSLYSYVITSTFVLIAFIILLTYLQRKEDKIEKENENLKNLRNNENKKH